MVATPFRALFLLRDTLGSIEVVPLGGTRDPAQATMRSLLSGRDELLRFVRELSFDSIVESYQVSDLPQTGFLYTFHISQTPEAIVDVLQKRLEPEIRTAYRVLEQAHERAPEQLTLSPHEAFQLGASTLSSEEGMKRMQAWFAAAALVTA